MVILWGNIPSQYSNNSYKLGEIELWNSLLWVQFYINQYKNEFSNIFEKKVALKHFFKFKMTCRIQLMFCFSMLMYLIPFQSLGDLWKQSHFSSTLKGFLINKTDLKILILFLNWRLNFKLKKSCYICYFLLYL